MQNRVYKRWKNNQREVMEYVKLTGDAFEVGKILGRVIREPLTHRLVNLSKQVTFESKKIKSRTEKLIKILEDIAPHWIEETKGIAETSGLNWKHIIAIDTIPPSKPPRWLAHEGCTSFAAVGNVSKNRNTILHKNRDERPNPQYAFIKKISDKNRYIAGVDIGNIGCAYFMNEKGLAGANNTGSPVIRTECNDIGLSDCHIMRIIAEECRDCVEAVEKVKEIIKRGYCGQEGYYRGMIFIFGDAHQVVVIENTSYNLKYKFYQNDLLVRANHFLFPEMKKYEDEKRLKELPQKSSFIRQKRAEDLLFPLRGKITRKIFQKVSRDTANYPYSIFGDGKFFPWLTLSTFTGEIDKDKSVFCKYWDRSGTSFDIKLKCTD